jgi:hypothetical protein
LNLDASAMTERHKEPHNAKMQQADFMSILQGLFHLYLMSNAYRLIYGGIRDKNLQKLSFTIFM